MQLRQLLGSWWRRRTPAEAGADAVVASLSKAVSRGGRVRAEEWVSATAAVVGEAIISAEAHFDPHRHEYVPGSVVPASKAEQFICAGKGVEEAPADSVAGILREQLAQCGYKPSDFPVLRAVFELFAAHGGRDEDWGKVPLSVPEQHRPFIMPLQIAYETRSAVDKAMARVGEDSMQRLRAATLALAKVLCRTRATLPPLVATTLAFETLNGMSRTAPMTAAAMSLLMDKARSAARQPPS